MSAIEGQGAIDLAAALEVIADLAREHLTSTGRPLRSIVAIGGTAMAAMALRERSDDIDLYVSEVDDDVLDRVTSRFKRRFGPAFKIDATPSKQLWGAIVVEDVDASPVVGKVKSGRHDISVRALSVETMYILKVAADRPKDQVDIETLARQSTFEAVLARAKVLFPFYADRGAFPEHAERLARYMARDFGRPLSDVDRSLDLPKVVAGKVALMREALELRFMQMLKALMAKRPELLSFDLERPMTVNFDARAAGAPDEVAALVVRQPRAVGDMAADALKRHDPKRHLARLDAIARTKRG